MALDRDEGDLAGGEEAADEDEEHDNREVHDRVAGGTTHWAVSRPASLRVPFATGDRWCLVARGPGPPAQLDRARRDADDGLPWCDVARDDRPGAGGRALADRHRGDHHRVDSQPRTVADGRAVLLLPIEVRRHRAGADVHVLSDLRVPQVAEVVLLAPGADPTVLDLG